MSEKRILCIEVRGECQFLQNIDRPSLAKLCECSQGLYCTKDISWKPITKDTCKSCQKARYQGITREQAIEKMAKSICSCDYLCGDCSCLDDVDACKGFIENAGYDKLAEAALDALLEANNEK